MFTYLGSPYSHKDPKVRQARYERVVREAGRLMLAGESIFCPIAHSHPIELATPGAATGHDFWMRQDLPVLRSAAKLKVLMLEGWEDSSGLKAEIAEAGAIGLPIEYVTDSEQFTAPLQEVEETIFEEAQRIIYGDREKTYGHPAKNFEATATLWSAYLEAKYGDRMPLLDTTDIALMMVQLKIAREIHMPKRDNLVDICGYTGCIQKISDYAA